MPARARGLKMALLFQAEELATRTKDVSQNNSNSALHLRRKTSDSLDSLK